MRELIQQGYVGQVLAVNMILVGNGASTRPSDRTWQRDATLGANTLTITFGHVLDAMCMVVGELTEVSAIDAAQVPQWFETDTKKYVDVTSPDNIVFRAGSKTALSSMPITGVHPYHGSGHRSEIYGKEGTLSMIGGGEGGGERPAEAQGRTQRRQTLKSCPCRSGSNGCQEAVRNDGPAYEVGQMWVKFADAIRTGSNIEPDFDHAVRATECQIPSCELLQRLPRKLE